MEESRYILIIAVLAAMSKSACLPGDLKDGLAVKTASRGAAAPRSPPARTEYAHIPLLRHL